MEVEVTAKIELEYGGEAVHFSYDDADIKVTIAGNETIFSEEDGRRFIEVFTAYLDGFQFPPVPDPNSDAHSAFGES